LTNRHAFRVSHAHFSLLCGDGAHAAPAKRLNQTDRADAERLPYRAADASLRQLAYGSLTLRLRLSTAADDDDSTDEDTLVTVDAMRADFSARMLLGIVAAQHPLEAPAPSGAG
jgi:hypothetical protein